MAMRKILYFLDFPSGFGGAANTTIRQAELMKDRGYEIMVIIPLDRKGMVINEFQDRCQSLKLNYSFLKYCVTAVPEDIDIVSLFEDYNNVENFIREWRPDIVHSTQLNITVEMVCRRLRIPHIMNIYQIEDNFFSVKYPDVFPQYHICDSELYRQKWHEYISVDSICIRNACKKVNVSRDSVHEETIFICAGSLCPRKNQLNIIKAFHFLVNEGISAKLILVGRTESDYGEKCIEYVKGNNLEDKVQIKGFIPFAEYEIAKSDALICGSIIESFPNVIGEAMAAGVPVISTPVAGVPEVLIDGENAYLTEGYEALDIYKVLRNFCIQRNTLEMQKLTQKALQTYQNEFSPEAVSERLDRYYQHVLGSIVKKDTLNFQIECLLKQYKQYVNLYNENEYKFKKPENVRRMLWLLPNMKEKMQDVIEKKIVIWGAGLYGAEAKAFAEVFFPEWKLLYYMDQKKNGKYLGITIVKPEKQFWDQYIIWIANIAGQKEAVEQLEADGRKYQKDVFIIAPRVW